MQKLVKGPFQGGNYGSKPENTAAIMKIVRKTCIVEPAIFLIILNFTIKNATHVPDRRKLGDLVISMRIKTKSNDPSLKCLTASILISFIM